MDTQTTTSSASKPALGSMVRLYNADGDSREVKLVDYTTDGKYAILNDGGTDFTRPISRLSPPLIEQPAGVIDEAIPTLDGQQIASGDLTLDPAKIADAQTGHNAVTGAFERADKGIDPSYWRLDDAVVAARKQPRTRIETRLLILHDVDFKLQNGIATVELDELKNDGWRVVHRQFIDANYCLELERTVIVDEPAPDQPRAAAEVPQVDADPERKPEIGEGREVPEIAPAVPETAIALPPDNPFKSQPLAVPTPVTEPQPALQINSKAMSAAMLRGQSASSVIAMMDQQLMQRSAQRRQAVQ